MKTLLRICPEAIDPDDLRRLEILHGRLKVIEAGLEPVQHSLETWVKHYHPDYLELPTDPDFSLDALKKHTNSTAPGYVKLGIPIIRKRPQGGYGRAKRVIVEEDVLTYSVAFHLNALVAARGYPFALTIDEFVELNPETVVELALQGWTQKVITNQNLPGHVKNPQWKIIWEISDHRDPLRQEVTLEDRSVRLFANEMELGIRIFPEVERTGKAASLFFKRDTHDRPLELRTAELYPTFISRRNPELLAFVAEWDRTTDHWVLERAASGMKWELEQIIRDLNLDYNRSLREKAG